MPAELGRSHGGVMLLYTCVSLLHIVLQPHLVAGQDHGSAQVHGSGSGLRLAHQQRTGAFIGWSEQHKDSSASTVTGSTTTTISSNGSSSSTGASSGSKLLVVHTRFGQIRIRLRTDLSPKIASLVTQLAASGKCAGCNFYRHEPAPASFGQNGFYGPPYALYQGSLSAMSEDPPFEGAPPVRKGDVCMIPRCKEFFIATADHIEWGTSHTVWGKIEGEDSWKAINSAPYEPHTNRTDSGGITTRWLTQEVHVPFTLSLEEATT